MRPDPAPHLRVIPGGRETGRNAPQRPPALGVAIILIAAMLPLELAAALWIL